VIPVPGEVELPKAALDFSRLPSVELDEKNGPYRASTCPQRASRKATEPTKRDLSFYQAEMQPKFANYSKNSQTCDLQTLPQDGWVDNDEDVSNNQAGGNDVNTILSHRSKEFRISVNKTLML